MSGPPEFIVSEEPGSGTPEDEEDRNSSRASSNPGGNDSGFVGSSQNRLNYG